MASLSTISGGSRGEAANGTVPRSEGAVDPESYLGAIGLRRAVRWEPTVRLLGQLHRAHVDTFAFASVGPALGTIPSLDLGVLERRLVLQRRGGYCLEHVTLFAAVLDALGFRSMVAACPGQFCLRR